MRYVSGMAKKNLEQLVAGGRPSLAVSKKAYRPGQARLDLAAIQQAYRRYARRYDVYFGALFQPGREAIIECLNCRPGTRILEVGVGTGLSLPLYPERVSVTGIDVSPEMLRRARARRYRARCVADIELRVMDAERMDFADDTFNTVVAMYVASVVAHPVRLIDEMRRVCKPEGELFILNHFHSANAVVGWAEALLAPFSRKLGFHPDFSLRRFLDETHLELIESRPVNLFGYWTLLRARNNKPVAADPTGGLQG